MKLKDLMEKYGEYEVNSKCVVGECEIERIVIDLTKPKPKSVWELNNKDEHYAITDCGFIKHYDSSDFIGYKRDIGNVFATEKDAEKECERRKVETLLLKHGGRRWFKKGGENWILYLDKHNQATRYEVGEPYQGFIYFDSHEEAVNACEQIGNKRIVNALFEVR